MSVPPKIDQLVELAIDSEFYPLSSVALKLALVLEERSESVSKLADLILSDVALTNRILRAVNSPLYRRPGWDGNVTTVSKALLLLGFDQVRDMALALEMLRQRRADLRNRHYERVCLQSMRAVGLVRYLVDPTWLEHATIPTLLRATGTAACALVAPDQLSALRDSGEDQIVAERLCRQWGLPEELVRTLTAPTRRARIPAGSDEYFRAISLYCHQLAGLWTAGMTTLDAPAAGWFDALHELTGLPQERIRDLLARAVEEADEAFEAALGGPGSLQCPAEAGGATAAGDAPADDHPMAEPLAETLDAQLSAFLDQQVIEERAPTRSELFIGAITDIQTGEIEGAEPRELCRMLLESLHRAMDADQTALFLVSRQQCVPLLGFGLSAARLKAWTFAVRGNQEDLVQATLQRRVDLLLHDLSADQAHEFLPDWLAEDTSHVRSMLLLPISHRDSVMGLVMCVSERPTERASREELMSLRLLKSQMLRLLRAATAHLRRN